MEKRSKYDTNPLDPDVEQKAEDSWGPEASGPQTQRVGRPTSQVDSNPESSSRQNPYSEAPTRRYDSNAPLEAPYPSVFVPPTYAPPVQTPRGVHSAQPGYDQPPTMRTVPGIGVAEKWAMMMAYAPYVGIVVTLIELFLVPRREVKVRFHASQALAVHIAILVIQTVFEVIATVSGSSFGGSLFKTAALVFLIISMIRVWRGQSHQIAPVAEAAQWFNQHIEPRNQA
jgi:uncharacterized membrane protein